MTTLAPMSQIFLPAMSHFSDVKLYLYHPSRPEKHSLLLHLNPSCHYHSLSCWPAHFFSQSFTPCTSNNLNLSPCPISATSPPTPTLNPPPSTTTAQPNPSSSSSPPYPASCSSPSSSGPTSTSPHPPNHKLHQLLAPHPGFPPSTALTTLSTHPTSLPPNSHTLPPPTDSP